MKRYAVAVVGLAFLLCLLALAGSAWGAGATYVVNSTADTSDGSCDPLGPTKDCTLREAIWDAWGDHGTVAFNIPLTDTNYGYHTAGVWTIVLISTLPSPDNVLVDGSTQATSILSDTNPYGPEIEISGENLSTVYCWSIGANGIIKGLAINRCPTYFLRVNGDNNTIVGNYIGTDATGSSDVSEGYDGILLGDGTENNTIGGLGEGDRNVISGLHGGGIRIFGSTSTGNLIQGNYIGTDRTGTQALRNAGGIRIHGGAHDNTVGPNNLIAYNDSIGVKIDGSGTYSNTITQNSIHANAGLGVDLVDDGNHLMAAPVISSTSCTSASGAAVAGAIVELFTGPDDEGKTYLTSVPADGSGNWSASGFLALGTYVSATATDAAGNTSEFSAVLSDCDERAYLPLATKGY